MTDRDIRWGEVKLAPVQSTPAPRATDEVLQHLMLAVLSDAINCYQEHVSAKNKRSQRLFQEAASWLEATEREYVFSFESICEALGFDAEYLRHGLSTWRKNELAEPSPRVRRRRRTRPAERRRRIVASL